MLQGLNLAGSMTVDRKGSHIVPPQFRNERVKAFFTTKHSGRDHASLDDRLRSPFERIYLPVQRHTSRIHLLRKNDSVKEADAVVTREKNVLIGVKVADCVPVLLYDRNSDGCGAVHAGWRGTADNILSRTIELMYDLFYSRPEDIAVAIGPAIRWCCYSVGPEVLQAVKDATGAGEYSIRKGPRICLDLPSANRTQALKAGIPESNIWVSKECTYCCHERFFSYRYSKRVFGSQGAFIGVAI